MVAVLIMVNRVDCSNKILYRAVSLPNVVSAPMIGRWEIPVDSLQLQIKSIAELPEGVVYINYRGLAQSCLFSVVSGSTIIGSLDSD